MGRILCEWFVSIYARASSYLEVSIRWTRINNHNILGITLCPLHICTNNLTNNLTNMALILHLPTNQALFPCPLFLQPPHNGTCCQTPSSYSPAASLRILPTTHTLYRQRTPP